jgi:hypothetical protein
VSKRGSGQMVARRIENPKKPRRFERGGWVAVAVEALRLHVPVRDRCSHSKLECECLHNMYGLALHCWS